MAPGTATTDSPYSSTGSQTIVEKNMDDEMPDGGRTLITSDRGQSTNNAFEPIREGGQGVENAGERAISSRPLSLHTSRSYGGGDGYGCMNDDEQGGSQDDERPHDTEKEFEVHWDGEDDPMNPRSISKLRKWLIVIIVSSSSLCVTCTSSLYTSTYGQITKEFHCSQIVATLGLSLFVMGLGIGPMLLGPLSEFYGRRPIYIVSFALFLIWIIPCAVAQNIQTMLIARFIDGLAGSAFLSVAGGTVGDLFVRSELQAPMMIYTASPFLGPEIGPIIGGFINQYASWRWSFYVLLIWSGAMLALITIFVPETYHPVLLRRKAQRLRKETGNEKWQAPIENMDRSILRTVIRSIYRPFQLLTLEPMCLNLCIYSAILLGVLYLFFGAFAIVFERNHGFELWQVGLTFVGLLVGMLVGISTDPLWHKNYVRLVRQREQDGGEPGGAEPEYRLPPAIAGGILVPIGLFWFGWTTYPSVHWIVPIIGSAIFGMGTLLVFSGVFTFLVDAYPMFAASALAANSFARSSFAAAFPLFGVQMYNKLGYQWATSLLAFLTVAMAPFPYVSQPWRKFNWGV
ncbi:MAG: hypothetical protein M1830_003183 [Pleopsidium flavum]|nr:MAG: hypothetical protein M1830_003183 [Pleopsidium flavum]